MSKPKFTKGKWEISGKTFVYALNEKGVNQFSLLVDGFGKNGAEIEELSANAHLIAAAPEMYKFLDDLANGRGIDYPIEKLLAKARGEHE
jgi:hypothetical protein